MIPAHKTTIMVHCLDTPKSWGEARSAAEAVIEVRRWHVQERGWSDIAYAAIVAVRGDWAKGRDLDGDGDVWEETGAGARGWNTNCIHIALVGGKGGSATDAFGMHYTPEQDATLRQLIADIERQAGRKFIIKGHNEVAQKACPCFDVGSWYAGTPAPLVLSDPIGGYPTLRIGSRGGHVKILQEDLSALRYHAGKIDGHFGPATQSAVVSFQIDQGLTADGIAGGQTWAALSQAKEKPDRTELDLSGSRTMQAVGRQRMATATQAVAGAGVLASTAITEAQDALSAVQGAGVYMEWMPHLSAALVVAGLAATWYVRSQSKSIAAARVDDAVTGRNMGR